MIIETDKHLICGNCGYTERKELPVIKRMMLAAKTGLVIDRFGNPVGKPDDIGRNKE